MKVYSITEARKHFTELLRTVEQEGAVQITCYSKVIALLLSPNEYDRLLSNKQTGFWNADSTFRQQLDQTGVDLEPDVIFADVRDQRAGREASW